MFVLFASPLLAWQSLAVSALEICILVVLCLCAGGVFIAARAKLLRLFHQPFATVLAMALATWLVALVFILALAWVNWNYVSYPGEIRTASLAEVFSQGMHELPQRQGSS